jgi:hypothetical protein
MDNIVETLQKNDYAIVKLVIMDELETPLDGRHKLKDGKNIFKCLAIYNDGSSSLFDPFWTCPIMPNNTRAAELDIWGVLGQDKQPVVVINATPNHQKYTELTCWVFPPKKDIQTRNAEIPHASISFDYSTVS